jgi:adenylate cyclase class 2
MQREIEIKAQVDNLGVAIQRLESLGCTFSAPIDQEDRIYAAEDIFSETHTPNPNVLRIRIETKNNNTRTLFTFKRNQSNELDCLERETEVGDPQVMGDILEFIGYQESIRVHKIRRKGTINGLEVCCDQVEGLGDFIEVEKMSDADGETVQAELWQWLEELNIGSLKRVTQGYDTLLYNKTHNS